MLWFAFTVHTSEGVHALPTPAKVPAIPGLQILRASIPRQDVRRGRHLEGVVDQSERG